jgi:hypothetical protein
MNAPRLFELAPGGRVYYPYNLQSFELSAMLFHILTNLRGGDKSLKGSLSMENGQELSDNLHTLSEVSTIDIHLDGQYLEMQNVITHVSEYI